MIREPLRRCARPIGMHRLLCSTIALPLLFCFVTGCAPETNNDRERQQQLFTRYESLMQDEQTRWANILGRSMTSMLLVEARRGRNESERTSLALKLGDALDLSGRGLSAVLVLLRENRQGEPTPFVATWLNDDGEKVRAIQGQAPAELPAGIRANCREYSYEVSFSGEGDERLVRVLFYVDQRGVESRLSQLRETQAP